MKKFLLGLLGCAIAFLAFGGIYFIFEYFGKDIAPVLNVLLRIIVYPLGLLIASFFGALLYFGTCCAIISLKREWQDKHKTDLIGYPLKKYHIFGLIITIFIVGWGMLYWPKHFTVDFFEVLIGFGFCGFLLWLIGLWIIGRLRVRKRAVTNNIVPEQNVPIRLVEKQLNKEQIDEILKAATNEKLDKALAEIEEEIERVKQARIERGKQRSRKRLTREAVLKEKKNKT